MANDYPTYYTDEDAEIIFGDGIRGLMDLLEGKKKPKRNLDILHRMILAEAEDKHYLPERVSNS